MYPCAVNSSYDVSLPLFMVFFNAGAYCSNQEVLHCPCCESKIEENVRGPEHVRSGHWSANHKIMIQYTRDNSKEETESNIPDLGLSGGM